MSKKVKAEDLSLMPPVQAALLRFGRPSSRWLLYVLIIGLLLFLAWASYTKIDEIVKSSGQVTTGQKVQVLQNLEGGILEEILVSEGQVVEKGQLLMRINNESLGSQYRDYLTKSYDTEASIQRLESRINGQPPAFSPTLQAEAKEIIERQLQLLEAERRQDQAELEVLESQKTLKVLEVSEQKERREQLKQSLALASRQREMARPLVQSKSYSQMDFLSLEQKVQSLNGEIITLDKTIPKLEESAKEAEKRYIMRQRELELNTRLEINKLQTELASIKEILSAGTDKVTRTEVKANIDGVIKKIHASTTGGAIKPAQDLIEIVPLDDELIIEAKVSPTDIGFIYPQQKAIIKLSAYDYSIYGGLNATVENISADTLEGKQGEIYYQVRLKTEANFLNHHGQKLPIIPGMLAQVDILTGSKSILDYLLKPILKSKQYALTER